jgi:hypothetical protein
VRPFAGALIATALCSVPLGVAGQAADLPVEALVAIVGAETPQDGTDLVLLSDVDLRARLDLGPHGVSGTPSPALYAATLDEIIGEILIAREADRLRASEPSEADVRAQRQRLVATLGGEEALTQLLARLGADASEVDAIARRRAVVEAFLRANLAGTTTVSDARVEEVWLGRDHPFGQMTLDQAREPLRAWIAMRALSDDVARWVDVLRQRTTVRVLVALDPGEPSSESEDGDVGSE